MHLWNHRVIVIHPWTRIFSCLTGWSIDARTSRKLIPRKPILHRRNHGVVSLQDSFISHHFGSLRFAHLHCLLPLYSLMITGRFMSAEETDEGLERGFRFEALLAKRCFDSNWNVTEDLCTQKRKLLSGSFVTTWVFSTCQVPGEPKNRSVLISTGEIHSTGNTISNRNIGYCIKLIIYSNYIAMFSIAQSFLAGWLVPSVHLDSQPHLQLQ